MQQLRTQHVAVQLPALEHNGEASALQASVLLNPLSKASRPLLQAKHPHHAAESLASL